MVSACMPSRGSACEGWDQERGEASTQPVPPKLTAAVMDLHWWRPCGVGEGSRGDRAYTPSPVQIRSVPTTLKPTTPLPRPAPPTSHAASISRRRSCALQPHNATTLASVPPRSLPPRSPPSPLLPHSHLNTHPHLPAHHPPHSLPHLTFRKAEVTTSMLSASPSWVALKA